jgi:UDP-N-acetylmuramyl pentapeptide phosphotransferase/UDP-N-acetylglucosamine-1-phosphate transferase
MHMPSLAPLALAFLTSCTLTWMVTRQLISLNWGQDKSSGIQKMHSQPTSRIGGLALVLAMCVGLYVHSLFVIEDTMVGTVLLLCSLPVFLGGLTEDLTHQVSPTLRLLLSLLSCSLIHVVLQTGVLRTDIVFIDWLLRMPGMTLLLTLLVGAGFINAINIIDGLHGLASGSVMVMLVGFCALAWRANDALVFQLAGITVAVTLGFFIWNWPKGLVFLGDGGAYFLGFWVVQLGYLLPHQTAELSPMAPVLVGIFPLVETLYTMLRRKFVRSHPIGHPDALHLHTLIYCRVFRQRGKEHSVQKQNWSNAKVSVIFWAINAIPCFFAFVFWNQTHLLLLCMLVFTLAYLMLYRRLVHFKTPRFLRRWGRVDQSA